MERVTKRQLAHEKLMAWFESQPRDDQGWVLQPMTYADIAQALDWTLDQVGVAMRHAYQALGELEGIHHRANAYRWQIVKYRPDYLNLQEGAADESEDFS